MHKSGKDDRWGGMKKVFIDGRSGTTGLRIYERLSERADIELLSLSDDKRHDVSARKKSLNEADIAFLCLPDDAARESADFIENPDTVVIDTSTAHRTADGWAYGFPELSVRHEEKIRGSKRIASPGCHASGFIALVYPLIEADIIEKDVLLSCLSLTGYSGGGKKMIAEYKNENKSDILSYPGQYGLSQNHKHLREMTAVTGLDNAPIFCPVVDDFYSGMEVTVPLFSKQLKKGKSTQDIIKAYSEKYNGPIVFFKEAEEEKKTLYAGELSGKDSMKVTVYGGEERILLTAVYDNLGKGASGAAIECMNIVMGKNKEYGLNI